MARRPTHVRAVSTPGEGFPARLRTQRESLGLTQARLASQLGCSQQRIAAWEGGERPTDPYLDALAEFLDMSSRGPLLRLLDDLSVRQDLAAATLRSSADNASIQHARDMLDQLAQVWIRRSGTMTEGEIRAHVSYTDLYQSIVDGHGRD